MVDKISETNVEFNLVLVPSDKTAYRIILVIGIILLFCLINIVCCVNTAQAQIVVVAKTIAAEACSEGPHGMMGVASTIKNRMDQRGLTAYEVVTELNQYYGFTHPNRDKIFSDPKCSGPALRLAKDIDKLPDITQGAIFFKTPEEKRQAWHKELTVIIGGLEFWK